MADTNPIKIFKGDDTDFNNSKFLSIKINTEMDLTGFKGIFKLGKFKTEQDMQSKTMDIVIPHEVTALMLNGTHTGIFTLIDTKNRVKTLSNTIPFLVTSEVFTQEEDSIDLPVPEGYPYEIIVELGSASDYNSLQNIPTFEGQPIKGNLTFQSTGIAPLESLDALVQVVNEKANTVDVQNACGQLQEQITTNKNDIDGLGDQVAGIEAKIPADASDTNQLADKAFVNAETAKNQASLDLKADKSDTYTKTEVDTFIAEQETNLTTVKNDLGYLGDQVSQIEAKIPETATEQNQLVTKEQMDDAIANAGTSVDLTGYYNRDNLLAADEIEIVEEPVEGGIDNHTLACWHFDGTKNDIVTGLEALMGNYDTSNKKFGAGAYDTSSAYSETNISSLGLNPVTKSATIDFWFKCITSSESCRIGFGAYSESNLAISIEQNSLTLQGKNWSSGEVINGVVPGLDFNHYAIQFNKETNKASVFFNGKKVAEQTPKDFSASSFADFVAYSYYRKNAIDELRISDIARYTEDFEPPTKPYSLAVPTGNKVINNTGVTSINSKTGNVILTGADIQTTYTYNSEETTTTVNAFADAVLHDIDNVVSLIPTKAVTSDNVTKIVKLTQAEYNALETKDDSTFYAIVG